MHQLKKADLDVVSEFFPQPVRLRSRPVTYAKKLPSMGVLHVKNMFNTKDVLNELIRDFEMVSNKDDIFDEQRHGSSHSIIGYENMKILRNQTETLNLIVDHLCAYFDLEPAQVRVNRYLSDEEKPAHQDAAAVLDSKASEDQNITGMAKNVYWK